MPRTSENMPTLPEPERSRSRRLGRNTLVAGVAALSLAASTASAHESPTGGAEPNYGTGGAEAPVAEHTRYNSANKKISRLTTKLAGKLLDFAENPNDLSKVSEKSLSGGAKGRVTVTKYSRRAGALEEKFTISADMKRVDGELDPGKVTRIKVRDFVLPSAPAENDKVLFYGLDLEKTGRFWYGEEAERDVTRPLPDNLDRRAIDTEHYFDTGAFRQTSSNALSVTSRMLSEEFHRK